MGGAKSAVRLKKLTEINVFQVSEVDVEMKLKKW